MTIHPHVRWLLEVTDLPTAAGREDRVIDWVEAWTSRRANLRLRRDRAGNVIITQRRRSSRAPIFITAHLDHPAFVVTDVRDPRTLELEFRGGVLDAYFDDAPIVVHDDADGTHRGRIIELRPKAKPFKRVVAKLGRPTDRIAPGDIGRWALRGTGATSAIRGDRLHAPACDDLAAVAAALSTLDVVRRRKGLGHVGVVLTRAEEIGFVGAIGVCKHGSVPKSSRLICLENSRSFPESPIGAGPIVRVGDKVSVFEPTLTNDMSAIAQMHAKRSKGFRWQRKLMPGGTCEATTFSAYGFRSTCVCLPMGNYHNMRDIDGVLAGARPARVGPEIVAVSDYRGMIELLVACATHLDARRPSVRDGMERYWREHRDLLAADA